VGDFGIIMAQFRMVYHLYRLPEDGPLPCNQPDVVDEIPNLSRISPI
jgi:hypothetical protein